MCRVAHGVGSALQSTNFELRNQVCVFSCLNAMCPLVALPKFPYRLKSRGSVLLNFTADR